MQGMRGRQGELFPLLKGPPVELPEEAKRNVRRLLADLMIVLMRGKGEQGMGEADSKESGNE